MKLIRIRKREYFHGDEELDPVGGLTLLVVWVSIVFFTFEFWRYIFNQFILA